MKNFLYYDEDSINSLLAQIEKGLQVHKATEKSEEAYEKSSKTEEERLTGDLSAKILSAGASLTGEKSTERTESEAINKLVKTLQEKVLSDYAFDRVYHNLTKKGLLSNEGNKIGDMLLVKDRLTFIDLKYIESLFSKDGAIQIFSDQKYESIEKELENLRKQLPHNKSLTPEQRNEIAEFNEKERQLKTQIKEQKLTAENQRKNAEQMIKVLRNLVPYNRFIMSQNLLIPIDDDYLRDKPEIIAFKYGGELSLLGYITNIIDQQSNKKENDDVELGELSKVDSKIEKYNNDNFLDDLFPTINQVMLGLFGKEEKVFIVHPIAIFYDRQTLIDETIK